MTATARRGLRRSKLTAGEFGAGGFAPGMALEPNAGELARPNARRNALRQAYAFMRNGIRASGLRLGPAKSASGSSGCSAGDSCKQSLMSAVRNGLGSD